MEANETLPGASPRDLANISPSAYALLMMKSHTSIPYAREAAALVAAQSNSACEPDAPPNPTNPAASHRPNDTLGFTTADPLANPIDYWTRVMHFESRYWNINQLLEDLTATNILEISSGFSFRGLDLSNKKPVFYIDTDLPDIVESKQRFIDAFATHGTFAAHGPVAPTGPFAAHGPVTPNSPAPANESPTPPPPGHYELHPLDALDPVAFEAVVNKFPPGPLTIINEGLLVYLDSQEKAQLCANIRKALLPRGGSWITADIYIKREERDDDSSDARRQWSREHGLEEKKFAGFHEAETFFHSMGFEIQKEATQDYSRLTSFPQFLKAAGPQALNELRRPGRPRLQATWRLTPRP